MNPLQSYIGSIPGAANEEAFVLYGLMAKYNPELAFPQSIFEDIKEKLKSTEMDSFHLPRIYRRYIHLLSARISLGIIEKNDLLGLSELEKKIDCLDSSAIIFQDIISISKHLNETFDLVVKPLVKNDGAPNHVLASTILERFSRLLWAVSHTAIRVRTHASHDDLSSFERGLFAVTANLLLMVCGTEITSTAFKAIYLPHLDIFVRPKTNSQMNIRFFETMLMRIEEIKPDFAEIIINHTRLIPIIENERSEWSKDAYQRQFGDIKKHSWLKISMFIDQAYSEPDRPHLLHPLDMVMRYRSCIDWDKGMLSYLDDRIREIQSKFSANDNPKLNVVNQRLKELTEFAHLLTTLILLEPQSKRLRDISEELTRIIQTIHFGTHLKDCYRDVIPGILRSLNNLLSPGVESNAVIQLVMHHPALANTLPITQLKCVSTESFEELNQIELPMYFYVYALTLSAADRASFISNSRNASQLPEEAPWKTLIEHAQNTLRLFINIFGIDTPQLLEMTVEGLYYSVWPDTFLLTAEEHIKIYFEKNRHKILDGKNIDHLISRMQEAARFSIPVESSKRMLAYLAKIDIEDDAMEAYYRLAEYYVPEYIEAEEFFDMYSNFEIFVRRRISSYSYRPNWTYYLPREKMEFLIKVTGKEVFKILGAAVIHFKMYTEWELRDFMKSIRLQQSDIIESLRFSYYLNRESILNLESFDSFHRLLSYDFTDLIKNSHQQRRFIHSCVKKYQQIDDWTYLPLLQALDHPETHNIEAHIINFDSLKKHLKEVKSNTGYLKKVITENTAGMNLLIKIMGHNAFKYLEIYSKIRSRNYLKGDNLDDILRSSTWIMRDAPKCLTFLKHLYISNDVGSMSDQSVEQFSSVLQYEHYSQKTEQISRRLLTMKISLSEAMLYLYMDFLEETILSEKDLSQWHASFMTLFSEVERTSGAHPTDENISPRYLQWLRSKRRNLTVLINVMGIDAVDFISRHMVQFNDHLQLDNLPTPLLDFFKGLFAKNRSLIMTGKIGSDLLTMLSINTWSQRYAYLERIITDSSFSFDEYYAIFIMHECEILEYCQESIEYYVRAFHAFVRRYQKVDAKASNQDPHRLSFERLMGNNADKILSLLKIFEHDLFDIFSKYLVASALPFTRLLTTLEVLDGCVDSLRTLFLKHRDEILKKNRHEEFFDVIHTFTLLSGISSDSRIHLMENLSVLTELSDLDKAIVYLNRITVTELFKHLNIPPVENPLILSERLPREFLKILPLIKLRMEGDLYEKIFNDFISSDLSGTPFKPTPKLKSHNDAIRLALTQDGIDIAQAFDVKRPVHTFSFGETIGGFNVHALITSIWDDLVAVYQASANQDDGLHARLDEFLKSMVKGLSRDKVLTESQVSAVYLKFRDEHLRSIEPGTNKNRNHSRLDFISSFIAKRINRDDFPMIAKYHAHLEKQINALYEFLKSNPDLTRDNLPHRKIFDIHVWDKHSPLTFNLGAEVSCCMSPDGHQFPAMTQRRMDDAMFMHVVTDRETGRIVSLAWLYFGKALPPNEGVYVVANYFEIAPSYVYNPHLRDQIILNLQEYIGSYARDIGAKGFIMKPLTYNLDRLPDFEGFQMIDISVEKLGGFLSISGAMKPYYLNSLQSSRFHLFQSRRPEASLSSSTKAMVLHGTRPVTPPPVISIPLAEEQINQDRSCILQ